MNVQTIVLDEKTKFHPHILGFIYFTDVNSSLTTVKIALGTAFNE